MKINKYYLKGADNEDKAVQVSSIVKKIIPEAEDVSVSSEESALIFSGKIDSDALVEYEKMLKGALLVIEVELILPANAESFSRVDKSAKKPYMIPLAVAVSLIAAFSVLATLVTFVICKGFI